MVTLLTLMVNGFNKITDEEESESSLFCAKNFIEKKFVLFYTIKVVR